MKRYLDFQREAWADRTASHMRAARRNACVQGIGGTPPCAGVIDTLPMDDLGALIAEGWVEVSHAPSDLLLRRSARRAMLSTLADDLDCLSMQEHTLVERMLIGDGQVVLDSVPELEAAYTLRMRLWCDLGHCGQTPCARLDAELMRRLPDLLMRPEHVQRRSRAFVFDGMISGLLYITGFLDVRAPQQRFVREVLGVAESGASARLARNHLEASFDVDSVAGCRLLLHEALAAPETLVSTLAASGCQALPPLTSEQLFGAMNGMLPEEAAAAEKLCRTLQGALRPDLTPEGATEDLRLLAKQDVPREALKQVMAGMLCVLPTPHMYSVLLEMAGSTPRWMHGWNDARTPATGYAAGVLH